MYLSGVNSVSSNCVVALGLTSTMESTAPECERDVVGKKMSRLNSRQRKTLALCNNRTKSERTGRQKESEKKIIPNKIIMNVDRLS